MLYNPKWLADQVIEPSMDGLIIWLEHQPPTGTYDYNNCNGKCLLGLYLNAIGLLWDEHQNGPGWDIWSRELWKGPLGDVSAGRPRTFGAALERARKLASP